jgi:hypothetical protein
MMAALAISSLRCRHSERAGLGGERLELSVHGLRTLDIEAPVEPHEGPPVDRFDFHFHRSAP